LFVPPSTVSRPATFHWRDRHDISAEFFGITEGFLRYRRQINVGVIAQLRLYLRLPGPRCTGPFTSSNEAREEAKKQSP